MYDYGKRAWFVFDTEVDPNTLEYQDFCIEDENGVIFDPYEARLGSDYKTVELLFEDFNAAKGWCWAVYTKGSLYSMAGLRVDDTRYRWLPYGLVPPGPDAGYALEHINIDSVTASISEQNKYYGYSTEHLQIEDVTAAIYTETYSTEGYMNEHLQIQNATVSAAFV